MSLPCSRLVRRQVGGLEGLDRQFLHAWRIQFISPSGKQIDMKSELPRELKKTLRALTSESE
jgi:hypothetical protein